MTTLGDLGKLKVNNTAYIDSSAMALSTTGTNGISSGSGAANVISTGMASSNASSSVSNVNVT